MTTSYKAFKAIEKALAPIFAELDAKVLAQSLVWVEERAAALVEFMASDEYQELRRDAFKVYPRMFDICGGKTWYTVINSNGVAGRKTFVEKNCKAIAAKRNATIANKLEKAGVTEVKTEQVSYTKDGFNGFFVVDTNTGEKHVKIQTIYAGGYNIQCAHLRVLCKVK